MKKNDDFNFENFEDFDGYEMEATEDSSDFDDVQELPTNYGSDEPSTRPKKGKKKKARQKNAPKKGNGNNVVVMISALAALVLAGGLFAWMVFSWRSTSLEVAAEARAINAQVEVIMASGPIDKNTVLDMQTISQGFHKMSVYADSVPEGAITEASDLLGLTVNRDVPMGAIMTQLDVTDYGNIVDANTVEISFPAAALANAAAGDIQPGERVNLNILTEEAYTPVYTTSIYKMYDGSGNEVKDGATAGIYSILVPAEDSATFYSSIQNGTMYIERLFS